MKHLSIKEKAKAYDELIKKLRDFYRDYDTISHLIDVKEELANIIPELKESENKDEKIRKSIVSGMKALQEKGKYTCFANVPMDDVFAWLEKQGNKPQGKLALEAIKEEKVDNANKIVVEPKFKVGDWIVSNVSHEDYRICKILKIENGEYVIESIYGYRGHNNFEIFDKDYHLWTIKDAKYGDILFEDLMGGKTFVYSGINTDMAILYSFIISNDGEDVLPYHIGKPNTGIGYIEENKNIVHPATQEQRDLLFSKMKEASYEWDAEKKELKKIEQNPENYKKHLMNEMADLIIDSIKKKYDDEEMVEALRTEYEKGRADAIAEFQKEWSEEDELHIRELESLVKQAWTIAELKIDKDTIHKMSDLSFFLKTLKPQLKQEWSEDDESILQGIWDEILDNKHNAKEYEWKTYDKFLDWLQSLKYRVQPKVELTQVDKVILEAAIAFVEHNNHFNCWRGVDKRTVLSALHSLRPQNQWKPSDEQMKALANALSLAKNCGEESTFDLRTLYEQLKKL